MTDSAIPPGIASAAGASRLASNDWERLPRSSTGSPVWPAPARSKGNADRRQGGRQTPEPLPFTLFGEIETDINKEWLCVGLIGAGELSALYGIPGSGKSVLGGNLAVFIARGTDWMGRKLKPGATVIVAAERVALTKRRLAAERIRGGSDAPVAIVPGPLDLCHGEKGTDRLIATLSSVAKATGQPVVFVLIDTVSQVLSGGDENAPKDMGNFVSNVTRIVQKTGAHVMLVHHSPADNPQKLRGHTALLGACDTTILVSKAGQFRRAEVMKANDADEGVAFTFDLESVELGTDQDGNVTTAPVVIPVETDSAAGASERKPKLSHSQEIALKALENALGDEGKVPPANNYTPPNTATVSVETWRRYAYSAGVSDTDNPEARKKAFQRVRDALKAKQHVWEHEGQAWII